MKKHLALFLVAVMILSMCMFNTISAIAEEVKPVRIGCLFPLSGSSSEIGNLFKLGIQMAVDSKNKNGGIKSMGGAPIELVWADSAGDPSVGAAEIERLIVAEKVDCLLGPYNNSVSVSTAPVAERYGVPYLLNNSNEDLILSKGYKYIFRVNHAISDAASIMVDMLVGMGEKTGAKVKSVAIVAENSDWGYGMATLLPPLCKAAGIECSVVKTYTSNAADLSDIVIKLKDANPDVVLAMCAPSDAHLLIRQMQEYGVNSLVFADGNGFLDKSFIESAGSTVEGIFATTRWDISMLKYKGAASLALNDQFKKDYSGGKDFSEFSASGWLNAAVMLNVLERAGSTDKEAILNALLATDIGPNDYELSLYPYTGVKFGEVRGMANQNIYSSKLIVQVQNGECKLVGPLSLVTTDKYVWPVKK